MKMTNYRLQTEIENIKEDKQDWFKNYVRQVLESNKPYHAKADYIGLSIKELDNKLSYIAEDRKVRVYRVNTTRTRIICSF